MDLLIKRLYLLITFEEAMTQVGVLPSLDLCASSGKLRERTGTSSRR